MTPREITDASFASVLTEGKPVVVDFWAPWCGPCRNMSKKIDKLAEDYADKVTVCKLNIDDNTEVCGQFGIMSIPTVLFFKNGELVSREVGDRDESIIRQHIEAML